MTDRRITAANGRVAHVSLMGRVEAEHFVEGEAASVSLPVADILVSPGGARDRQLLFGDRVLVLERYFGFAFVRSEKDGYCGYVAEAALGPDRVATHWVAAPATHVYPAATIKRSERMMLSLGARLSVVATEGNFARTADGGFVPRQHLRAVGDWRLDPVDVARDLLGTPYLWGGNSRNGIDCSGLVQAALLACGIACPGDSDLQFASMGRPLAPGESIRAGDLLFWRGHVAMASDDAHIIHANGAAMAVTVEGLQAALNRIAAGEGADAYLGARRLAPSRPGG